MSGIPSNTAAAELEETVLKVFEKLDVDVDSKNVEDYHWLKTRNSSKKVIIKLYVLIMSRTRFRVNPHSMVA